MNVPAALEVQMNAMIRRALARIDGARAARDLAAAARIPTLDAAAMVGAATGNVTAGSFFPMSGVPGSSGPVGTTSLGGAAWTTTAALVSTVPLTGFVRANRLPSARAAAEHAAESGADAIRLDVAILPRPPTFFCWSVIRTRINPGNEPPHTVRRPD